MDIVALYYKFLEYIVRERPIFITAIEKLTELIEAVTQTDTRLIINYASISVLNNQREPLQYSELFTIKNNKIYFFVFRGFLMLAYKLSYQETLNEIAYENNESVYITSKLIGTFFDKTRDTTYINILTDSVIDNRVSLINTLINNVSFKWTTYKNIIESVIIPKLNIINDERISINNKLSEVNENIYFLSLLVTLDVPEVNSYFGIMMKNAKNGIIYIAPVLALNVNINGGLIMLKSDIKYEDYVAAYLKDFIIYDKKLVTEVYDILKKFSNRTIALSVKFYIDKLLPKYPNINKIVGPTHWSYFRYKGRNIHIFGEYHMQIDKTDYDNDFTMNIIQLFKYISQRSIDEEKVTNFYLESQYMLHTERQVKYIGSYLNHVIGEFKPCLQRIKTKCPYYPYAKYHYVDVRHVSSGMTIMHYIINIVENITENKPLRILGIMNHFEVIVNELKMRPDLLFEMYVDKDQGNKLLEVFIKRMGIKTPIYENFKTGTMMHKVRWQLKNIDTDISQKIRNFSYIQYKKGIDELINLMDNKWPNIKNEMIFSQKFNTFKPFAKDIYNKTVEIASVFMDTYYLARLFRSMNWDPKCKLFITYVGDGHKERYDKFLNSLSDVELINKEDNTAPEIIYMLHDFAKEFTEVESEPYLLSLKFKTVFGEDLFK
jgi:hypothetical protein